MPYSINWKGKVLDYNYRKMQENHFAFYIGNIYVGQLFKNTGRLKYWSAVAKTPRPNSMHSVSGFYTRWKACEWLLKAEGYTVEGLMNSDIIVTCDGCGGCGYTIDHKHLPNDTHQDDT